MEYCAALCTLSQSEHYTGITVFLWNSRYVYYTDFVQDPH